MKIAVTYDNGNIFQHFGRTETFKVYEVEDGKVVSSQVIGSGGVGHGALAGVLAEQKVDVLICGGKNIPAKNTGLRTFLLLSASDPEIPSCLVQRQIPDKCRGSVFS